MRVVLVNQFFWPDSAPTAEYAADVAEELKRQGHDVFVLCASHKYGQASDRSDPGVRVVRLPAWHFARQGWRRVVSHSSFLLLATLWIVLTPRIDCVVTMTTPPFLAVAGTAAKLLKGTRHVCWEMDLFPELAVELTALRGTAARIASSVARWLRSHADRIVVLGPCMAERLIAGGVPRDRVSVAQNWADPTLIEGSPVPRSATIRLLYSGNAGRAHELETLLEALKRPELDRRVRVAFAVDDEQAQRVARLFEPVLDRVDFRAMRSRSDVGAALANCEIGLVCLDRACSGTLVPSKFYGLLAAGRPVLFIGPSNSTVARVIGESGCGWAIPNGRSAELVALLNRLCDAHEVLEKAGVVARELLERQHSRAIGVRTVTTLITGSAASDTSVECTYQEA